MGFSHRLPLQLSSELLDIGQICGDRGSSRRYHPYSCKYRVHVATQLPSPLGLLWILQEPHSSLYSYLDLDVTALASSYRPICHNAYSSSVMIVKVIWCRYPRPFTRLAHLSAKCARPSSTYPSTAHWWHALDKETAKRLAIFGAVLT